ncbi:MAG: hypothetical protein L0Y73_03640, partial [Candidatus Aminicenantes bacterium]|nr:hypothetical protein [Candidatus Aminicenantes bacterium]
MKSRSMSIVLFILCLGVSLFAGRDFQLVEKWKHDAIMPSFLFDAVVDRDGDLLTAFQKAGVKIANAKKIVDLGPFGQGPGDLDGFFTLFFCKGDLAVEGTVGKLQLFHKQGGKYIWKQNIWKKRGASYQFVWDGQFMDGKWFFAGPSMEKRGENIVTLYYIKVYAEDGKLIKNLLEKKIKTSDLMPYLHLLFYYLEQYRGSLFFISENAP